MLRLLESLDLQAGRPELRAWLDAWFTAYEADGGVISTWQDMQSSGDLVAFSQEVAATAFALLEAALTELAVDHPQVAAAMLLALLERAPHRVYALGASTREHEIDATVTIIRRGFVAAAD